MCCNRERASCGEQWERPEKRKKRRGCSCCEEGTVGMEDRVLCRGTDVWEKHLCWGMSGQNVGAVAVSLAMAFQDRKAARIEVQRQLAVLFTHVQKVCMLRGGFLIHASCEQSKG